jgi:Flp pilus assembly protein TadG
MKRLMTKTLSETKATCAHIRRFRQKEEGGMIIFSLFMFVLILALAGMAVDLMRFETTRAKLQATLDRAVLAAADLDQPIPPADVVRDYFQKTGMTRFLDGAPIVDEGVNFREVTANGRAEIPTFFFGLPNFLLPDRGPARQSLFVSGSSTAEERVTDVEVSLVLDVSGSMARNNRIQNLRPAARDFVTTVLSNNTNAPQGLITISMVPYSAVVSTGTTIDGFLPNINRSHMYSTCPLFDTSMFSSTALNLEGDYDHVSHFDPDWYSADAKPIANPWCHTGDFNAIIPVTSNEGALHAAITALEPYGNTAIDMGMKWGVALLDPSTRSMITALSATPGSGVDSFAAGRPYAHTQSDVAKVIVLMTDGNNTQQYDLREPYKNGLSYIWFNLDDVDEPLENVYRDDISIQYEGLLTPDDYSDDLFYIGNASYSDRWKNHPDGFSSNAEYTATMLSGPNFTPTVGVGPTYGNNVRNVSWQELSATWEHNRINNELLSRAYNDGAIPWSAGTGWTSPSFGPSLQINLPDYVDPDRMIDYSVVDGNLANTRLSSICEAARNAGVIIYTVAFEAPSGGQAALRDCATSPYYYFEANGDELSEAFSEIATDIRSLKLTQ